MKKLSLAFAVLTLVGGGCLATPAPQTSIEQPPVVQPPVVAQPVAEDPQYGPTYKAEKIKLDTLKVGDVVASPLTITGKARGSWFFEASFPVKLVDANNKLVANGVAQAKGEWMTTEFVPYSVTLTFAPPATATGTLILQKDNPSGLPANDDEMRLPVRFVASAE